MTTAPAAKSSSRRWLFPAVAIVVAFLAVFFSSYIFQSAEMRLNSNPAGATVLLNGRLIGATPVNVAGLQPGTYSLRLEKEGYAPLVRTITLAAGANPLNENMPAHGVGTLKVDIKPRGAEVLLSGEFLGYTPLNLSNVPVGVHELMVRKTNFKTYVRRIEVTEAEPLEFKDFPLEDKILTMLRAQVEAEKHRVAHYMDLGHYLFVNDDLDEAAEVYAKALQVASSPIEFAADTPVAERQLEIRLRAEDVNRLNDELRKKQHWPQKDVARFNAVLDKMRENVADKNVTQWVWVQEQTANFVKDGKLERARKLLNDHIEAAKGSATLHQAYITLMSLHLRMHNLDGLRSTYSQFYDLYSMRPELVRQAGNAIYTAHMGYQGEERTIVLTLAEKLFRKGIATTQRKGDPELNALCKFELGNIMVLLGNHEGAAQMYDESVAGTNDASTKELRSQRLVDSLRALRRNADAKKVLLELVKSPREHIAIKAKVDLKEVEQQPPSPDNK